jgi:hypothetical protein
MNKQFSNIAGFLLAVSILSGCASMSNMKTVEVDVLTPAEITLPDDIANLVIIDRTVYTGNPFDSNEAIFTSDLPGERRGEVKNLIFYLQAYLGGSDRFQSVVASEFMAGNSFSRGFPRQIPWQTVMELCRRYQADVLVAFEVYDSDYNVATNVREASMGQQAMLDDPYQARYSIRASGNVIAGFRVYDPRTETIVDEQLVRLNENYDAVGPDPIQTRINLPRKEDAIGQLVAKAGLEYAKRIAPIPIPVEREYYGGSGETPLAKGTELAEGEQWQLAAETWEAAISEASKSDAGKLAYNVALAYEVLGQTERAEEWAEKAQNEYGNSKAKELLTGLEEKRTLETRASGQMGLPIPF